MPLTTSTGAQYARILGIGAAVPSRVVDNEEMCTYIDSSDEWIQQRTGIVERRWAAEGETVESLSLDAARQAIERAGLTGADIDAVIVSTVSHMLQTPSLAAHIAAELGTDRAAAFDIAAACAGFCYGLAQAESLIRSGAATRVVVIGAETLSRITDLSDRSTAFLFADGAGAAVVGPSDTPAIGPVVWGSDGHQYDAINMSKPWPEALEAGETSTITMEGRAVFRWATGFIATAAQQCLDAAGITADELDVFVPTRPTTASPTRCCATSPCPTTSRWPAPSSTTATTPPHPSRSPSTPCSPPVRPRAATWRSSSASAPGSCTRARSSSS